MRVVLDGANGRRFFCSEYVNIAAIPGRSIVVSNGKELSGHAEKNPQDIVEMSLVFRI